jgi:hypothetical protein
MQLCIMLHAAESVFTRAAAASGTAITVMLLLLLLLLLFKLLFIEIQLKNAQHNQCPRAQQSGHVRACELVTLTKEPQQQVKLASLHPPYLRYVADIVVGGSQRVCCVDDDELPVAFIGVNHAQGAK